jgi:hypothetical protein
MVRTKLSMVLLAFAAMLTLGAGSAIAGTITGTVNGLDGKPASGVNVRLMKADAAAPGSDTAKPAKEKLAKADKVAAADGTKPAKGNKPGKGGAKREPVATATTAADGTFKFENVADGEYYVVASQKDVGNGRATASVKGDGKAELSITLKPRKPKA